MSSDEYSYAVHNNNVKEEEGIVEYCKKKKWTNMKIDRSMVCRYDGKCHIDSNMSTNICIFCIWLEPLDIPKMLEEYRNGS